VWTERALSVVERDQAETQASLESARADLVVEEQLRSERQRLADEAREKYFGWAGAEHLPPRETYAEVEYGGRRVRVLQDAQPVKRLPVYIEDRGRSDSSPTARAYWVWKDREGEVVTGPRHDRRMVTLADGRVMARQSWLIERIGALQRPDGLCSHQLSLLRQHLERFGDPQPSAPATVNIVWDDTEGVTGQVHRYQVPASYGVPVG
jgi:hypothetical protein